MSSAYRAQSDQRQWALAKRTGRDLWEGIVYFHSAADALAWLRTQEPGIPGEALADLDWVAAAEQRHLADLRNHPRALGITYQDLPKRWRHEIPGVAVMTRDAYNVIVVLPWRARKPLFYPRLDQAVAAAWAYRALRDPAEGARACVDAMERLAEPVLAWLADVPLPDKAETTAA
ncbi:hypothetical protein [Algiphilus sp.]|uniref:hypothetical protein n=1 Tax=Algiphilus sp. TaxID=1872431 RepID=UPI003C45D914